MGKRSDSSNGRLVSHLHLTGWNKNEIFRQTITTRVKRGLETEILCNLSLLPIPVQMSEINHRYGKKRTQPVFNFANQQYNSRLISKRKRITRKEFPLRWVLSCWAGEMQWDSISARWHKVAKMVISSNDEFDLAHWKQYDDLFTESLWVFGSRDSAGVHNSSYHGNFIPQIPNQLIRRFT